MQLLVASKIPKAKYPPEEAYPRAVANALSKPKRFREPFKKKSFTIVNIIYYLSQEHPEHGHFPIPAKRIAATAHTTPEFVYALIALLKEKGFIKVVNDFYKPGTIGKVYEWLEKPLN